MRRIQRRRVGVALRDGEKLNECAHRRLVCHGEIENAKQVAVISPHSNKLKSCLAGEFDETFRSVFVGIFSDDFLSRMEMKLLVFNSHSLIDFADEIDLDPAFVRIVNRVMPPLSEIEIRSELAIRAREQIQIKLGGHTGAVVVSVFQDPSIFSQIDANQKPAVIFAKIDNAL